MRGQVRAALMLGAAIGLTAGCAATDRTKAEPGTVTLVFKHGKIAGSPGVFRALLDRFEVEHPGIRVRDEALPSSTDLQHQFYVISLDGRSADFDVLSMDVIWVQEFARAGWIRDLSALLPPQERAAFFPGPVEAVTFEGRVYAVPWYIDAGLLYYRKDLLDKYGLPPPRTWEELVGGARTILDGERDPRLTGFLWQGKQYEGLVCNALEYIGSDGGSVLDRDGRLVLAGAPARKALAFMRDLIVRYKVSPPLVTTADEEMTRRIFGDGRAVFLRNWPYAWNLFERQDSKIRGKIGVVPLPGFSGHAPAATLGGWQLGVNRRSRHAEAAEALIRFLTSASVQKRTALEIGYKPVRKALYRDGELLRAQPFLADLYDVFISARPRPVTPYYLMLSQVMQPEFSAALVGLKSPETALEDAQLQMSHILFGRAGT
jgi:trehalose/maltose transport system substrate-binding protein